MAYGGRAYDDDTPWWKEDTNTTSQPSTAPVTPTTSHNQFGQGSHGVYNGSSFGSAYDDDNHTYSSSVPSRPSNTNTSPFHQQSSSLDPYEAIRAKSKMQSKSFGRGISSNNNSLNLSKSDHHPSSLSNQPNPNQSHSNPFLSKPGPLTSSQSAPRTSNGSSSKHSKHSKPSMQSRKGRSSSSTSGFATSSLRSKYKSGRSQFNENESLHQNKAIRPRRVRPDLNEPQQRMEYKQQLRESTVSKLDESLQTAYQSEQLAADSAERLHDQRKQLENVDKMLHETDDNLNRTEHTLKGMKSIWGGIGNYFKKAPQQKPYRKRDNNNYASSTRRSAQSKGMALERERVQKKKERVSLGGGNKEEDDMFNDKLDELHKSVQRMRMMSENMNRELDEQNQLIGDIDTKMDRVKGRINRQNDTMKRIR